MDELTLNDLAQWNDAAWFEFDDIGLTSAEIALIMATCGQIVADPEYADIYDAEGCTDPPTPRIRLNLEGLRRLREKILSLLGTLWARLKAAHKKLLNDLIDYLLQGHPLPANPPATPHP